jgi:DnaK suppressor protein
MPRKKVASKKRAAPASRKKTASRKKPAAKKQSVGNKRKVSKKKASTRKVSSKKAVSRKKPAVKKASKKKVSKKKAASKKKVAKKKVARKKVAKKAVSKKKVSRKKPAAKKKASKKKASTKKVATRKAPSRKKPAAKTKATVRRSAGDVLSGPIHGIEPYQARRGEEYMSADQLAHFETILLAWKKELMTEVDRTVHHMQDEAANFPDPNDRATQESEFGLELRTRDRERKLLRKINSALTRIEEGTYGYCEETGEEIGLKRLEARPVATLCVEAQERRELAERQFRDRDDRYR